MPVTGTDGESAEQRWIRLVAEAVPNAMLMTDRAGKIVMVNAQAERAFGYSRAELLGRPVEMLVPKRHRSHHPALREMFFTDPRPRPMGTGRDLHGLRKDGSEFPVEIGLNVIETGDGAMVLLAIVDLTQRKQAELALHDAQAELSRVARIATMGQLAASVAHEVNQPFTAIVTNAQAALRLLGAGAVDLEEVRQALVDIADAGKRAGDVITRIRNMIKRAPPREERLDINDAVREVIDLARAEAIKSNVTVRTELAAELPFGRGDRVELQQVILNLIVNAIEAMSEDADGTRDLLIRTERAGSDLLVEVRDSGPGLPSADLERIFEPFHTTKGTGLGLGLATSRSIIEAHRGRLWARPNAPRGAIFQFTVRTDSDGAS